MSLTIIAMTGILLGFLCLMIGFFMEGTDAHSAVEQAPKMRVRKSRTPKKRVFKMKKAA